MFGWFKKKEIKIKMKETERLHQLRRDLAIIEREDQEQENKWQFHRILKEFYDLPSQIDELYATLELMCPIVNGKYNIYKIGSALLKYQKFKESK